MASGVKFSVGSAKGIEGGGSVFADADAESPIDEALVCFEELSTNRVSHATTIRSMYGRTYAIPHPTN